MNQFAGTWNVRHTLWFGGYCRSGDSGRGQVWWKGHYVGHVGPKVMRELRREAEIEERTVTIAGATFRAYCASGVPLWTADQQPYGDGDLAMNPSGNFIFPKEKAG